MHPTTITASITTTKPSDENYITTRDNLRVFDLLKNGFDITASEVPEEDEDYDLSGLLPLPSDDENGPPREEGDDEIMKAGDFMEAEGDINGNTLPQNGVPRWGPQHAGAQQLASMYSSNKRMQETICTYLSLVIGAFTVAFILCNAKYQFLPYMILSFVAAGFVSDFLSGLLHWGADSWGSVELPIIGKAFLRPFREHHIDPTAITRHDFIETSGDLCAVTIPIFAFISYKQMLHLNIFATTEATSVTAEQTVGEFAWSFFLFTLAILILLTNTFHKWSHTYFGLPAWVEWLQRAHLILPKRHHRLHHISPHDTHFCITTGWLNQPLHVIGFWPKLEALITKLTGAVPRSDDLAWATKVTKVE